jgi:3-methyl-2-oxobutanoate hydroxymethyltransferase
MRYSGNGSLNNAQSIYKFGTYTVRAKEEEEADKLVEDAKLLERLGCFALVLEKNPSTPKSSCISIPVGIGAWYNNDMLGMNNEFSPRFLRRYMNLYEGMTTIGQYVADVKSSDFPKKEQY